MSALSVRQSVLWCSMADVLSFGRCCSQEGGVREAQSIGEKAMDEASAQDGYWRRGLLHTQTGICSQDCFAASSAPQTAKWLATRTTQPVDLMSSDLANGILSCPICLPFAMMYDGRLIPRDDPFLSFYLLHPLILWLFCLLSCQILFSWLSFRQGEAEENRLREQ